MEAGVNQPKCPAGLQQANVGMGSRKITQLSFGALCFSLHGVLPSLMCNAEQSNHAYRSVS